MYTLPELEKRANLIRQDIVKMLVKAGSGHSAGPLGMADIFTVLYFNLLNHRPSEPKWEKRDRLVLSNGHICPLLYTTLAHAGYFSLEKLEHLREVNSPLEGHPHRGSLPGVENSSGPLGQGLSVAVGMALSAQRKGEAHEVVCITSDGEQQEGQSWEAYMAASKYKLSNLTFILDRNSIQIDGYTYDVMPLEPLKDKYLAFGLNVIEIDGHNFEEITEAYHKSKAVFGRPTMIIAHTIPGKDVEFMENLPQWHGSPPKIGEAVEALWELRTLQGQIDYES
jgi:transketolase